MTPALPFPIVGIGASAGGVEALEGFFRGLPDQPGLAIVIVTHLSPQRESLLDQIVAHHTSMAVHIAADGMVVQPDHVYVLPADAILSIAQGRLAIRRPEKGQRERRPIDIFFSSLAADHGERAAGIVLSGGDSDGTLGIKAIKEHGGLTLAQVRDGYGPNHPDMPDSAIASGLVDFAVPAEAMGAKLVEFARGLDALEEPADAPGKLPALTEQAQSLDAARPEICTILRSQIGHDFSGYKTKTFLRRVQRRMQITQLATVAAYVERLRQDAQEVGALFRDLLINVTNFFRDTEAFECLAASVIPAMFNGRGADDTLRVWVPGCSTGEEVYSIAILLREQMEKLSGVPRVQIFATDIDERSLAIARAARYPAALLENVTPARRERYFVQDGGSSVVAKEVRDLCIFSPHSVIRDPPFSRIDLISCRNLLIYFGVEAQNQVIPIFHYALRPDGFLFLGTSENVNQFGDLFTSVEKAQRIFRRRSDIQQRVRLPLTVGTMRIGQLGDTTLRQPPLGGAVLRQMVDNQVLERYAPPHVLINRDGDVVYFSARTGKYLEAAPGAPTRQILTMARKGLRLDLRALFRDAMEKGHAVTREGVSVEGEDGRVQIVNLSIEPLNDRNGGEPLFLVLFTDQGPVLSREEAVIRIRAAEDGTVQQTERELRDTRERLQSLIEEYETALEELKSSNEELVSVNEELQSTNEELEASKEELVSVNEELHTVNGELSGKVEALDLARNDLQNLFDSTDVPTVFLDRKLVIRSFTPAMTDVFNILPSDRGRPITDLSSRLALPGFADDIVAAFGKRETLERRVGDPDRSKHYLVRMAPYRTSDQTADGVVITFLDITSITRAEARQQVLIAELQHRTRNLLAVIQSVARQTLESGPQRDIFQARLAALGRAQDLTGAAKDDWIDLGQVVRLELEALGTEQSRITIAGPDVSIGVERIQTLALALHELATNALKYGALKSGQGRLTVTWSIETNDKAARRLILLWRETGLAERPDANRRGFGRKLIEQALEFTLQAKSELVFEPNGVTCRIEMPL